MGYPEDTQEERTLYSTMHVPEVQIKSPFAARTRQPADAGPATPHNDSADAARPDVSNTAKTTDGTGQ